MFKFKNLIYSHKLLYSIWSRVNKNKCVTAFTSKHSYIQFSSVQSLSRV